MTELDDLITIKLIELRLTTARFDLNHLPKGTKY